MCYLLESIKETEDNGCILNMTIDKIRTVGELRRIIKDLSDDYEVEDEIRRKLSDDEIIESGKQIYGKDNPLSV